MAELVLEHVSKTYSNGVEAVRDLSLPVSDGELVVIVGPSGCGKSTTLRLIAGLEEPTEGTIAIGGRIVNALPPRQRSVAMVFQRSTLYPHLTVRRNLLIPFALGRQPWPRWLVAPWLRPAYHQELLHQEERLSERVTEVTRLLALEDLLDRRPGQLSGGEQQRVALGRAIVRQPSVFLLDEPLSHLDGILRAELRRELHLLQRRLRATMVYVTHDQAEAMTLADRVVVIDRGVVQQVGRPMAVYERPCNRFVAGFVGWPAMNLVNGRLVSKDGGTWFATADWSLPLPAHRVPMRVSRMGEALTLGIRPEHVRPIGTEPGDAGLAMEVALVEPLGHEWLVTFQRDALRVTARLADRQGIVDHQMIKVVFLMEHAHWFDGSSGLALSQGRPAG